MIISEIYGDGAGGDGSGGSVGVVLTLISPGPDCWLPGLQIAARPGPRLGHVEHQARPGLELGGS